MGLLRFLTIIKNNNLVDIILHVLLKSHKLLLIIIFKSDSDIQPSSQQISQSNFFHSTLRLCEVLPGKVYWNCEVQEAHPETPMDTLGEVK